ncbi:MAG: histidine kinase dimerization/phosphoacceptor domain -containing protein, partial [Brevinematales bacterium]
GSTGGRMISYEQLGKTAGGSVIRFLKGAAISEIKDLNPARYTTIFDWRELKRWGIPLAILPEGSEVRYREYTFLEKYFFEILILAAVILAESILIVFLLINISKRRTVQRDLRESESRYRGIIEESFEGICVTDEQGRIISWNRVMENISGIKAADTCGHFIRDIELAFPEGINEELLQLLKTGNSEITDKVFEKERVLENGGLMHLETRLFSFATDKGYILIIIVLDITERKRSEQRIQNALEEKEALLRELYHRTKNNMQIINSLLSLEAGFLKDPGLKNIFQDMENRIHSIALVHQKLYQSKDLSRVYLKEYIDELVSRLKSVYVLIEGSVNIVLDIENLPLQIDSAIPFGLILNELVSNSYKHAFLENSNGKIIISLHKSPDGLIKLIVCDNGIGVREGFDFRENSRMGLRTVFWIGEQQLRGQVIFEPADGDGGVKCTVSFNEINVTGGV